MGEKNLIEQARGYAYVIKQLELALRPLFAEVCAAGGLNWSQYTALSVLERRPGITSSELARRTFVRPQTMAATMDPLFEADLVRREKDPLHGRRQLLFLTAAGEGKLAEITPGVAALEERMVSDLDAAERDDLDDLLRRCRRALDAAGR